MFLEMKPTLEKFLQDEKNKIVPKNFKGEIKYIVSKHLHPDEEMIHFLTNLKSELIVVSTRGKHGIKGTFHKLLYRPDGEACPLPYFGSETFRRANALNSIKSTS